MCGICGRVNYDIHEPVSSPVLEAMARAIEHRGPDGAGLYVDGPIGLGHRRLSIIDLETGAQPMSNEDSTVWVVFNGEIYNFEALRHDLLARGHRFKSASDTEVIVHLYEEYGDACIARLQGMFAFALWDGRRRRLLMARDRVGIKPLYYMDTGRALLFASEIKSILADPSVQRRVDLQAVDRFLTYYYIPGDITPVSGIRKLLPGHYLVVDQGRIETKQYWDLEFESSKAPASLERAAESLSTLLAETVKSHMISDVPVGVLLSGGVDSTGILHHATRQSSSRLHTFTMGFGGAEVTDERPYAKLAADHFGSLHHETSISAEMFGEFLPRYIWHMEELVCEPPAVALYFVSKLARDHGVKVLLSGEGGDEAFAGYPEYRNLVALERLKGAAGMPKSALTAAFWALQRAGWQRGRHYQDLVGRQLQDYYFSRTSSPDTPFNCMKRELYGPTLAALADADDAAAPTRALMASVSDQPLLNRLLYVDTKSWLPDDLLVKADKMSMAASVELRVPLLDHRVLEFAASLPTQHKAKGWSLKRVLKRALRDAVPAQILNRKKAGFPVPYGGWLRRELRDQMEDTIASRDSFSSEHFSKPVVRRLLESHRRGEGHSKEVFSLLVLDLWYQRFIRGQTCSASSSQAALTA
jgi:asparagine synthase (glutamine-hydrolysing)